MARPVGHGLRSIGHRRRHHVGMVVAWVRRDIDSFPPVLGLGLGGKDACLGSPPAVVVAKPPFTPDQVPTPTPTPDK